MIRPFCMHFVFSCPTILSGLPNTNDLRQNKSSFYDFCQYSRHLLITFVKCFQTFYSRKNSILTLLYSIIMQRYYFIYNNIIVTSFSTFFKWQMNKLITLTYIYIYLYLASYQLTPMLTSASIGTDKCIAFSISSFKIFFTISTSSNAVSINNSS